MKIGLYDSGIGGLSVLQEAYHLLPEEEYLFYADTDHVPYGLKTPDEILGFARESVRFLVEQGVDAVVIACNTATSVAVKPLREEYSLPIISMEPAVKPAVKLVKEMETASNGKKPRVLVMATPVTLREEKLRDLMRRFDDDHRVDLLAMPELVRFAEREEFSGENVTSYLAGQFASFHVEDYGALVLGCTHFNYFKNLYHDYFPETTHLMDGNVGTVRRLADQLGILTTEENEREVRFRDIRELTRATTYYSSGRKVAEPEILEHFLRLHNRLEEMRPLK
ncbi:MAG: glutamate racemase [Eubacterium sp.]|nr:glutamate racemase [Eubacterium sp.]MBR6172288.1 glutamate racemase [Eubacterium sp.]